MRLTRILAETNKYSFVWKNNTGRFDEMNREKRVGLLGELHEAKVIGEIPAVSNITPDPLDMMISNIVDYLVVLEQEVAATEKSFAKSSKTKNEHFDQRNRNWLNDEIRCENTNLNNQSTDSETAIPRLTIMCGEGRTNAK